MVEVAGGAPPVVEARAGLARSEHSAPVGWRVEPQVAMKRAFTVRLMLPQCPRYGVARSDFAES